MIKLTEFLLASKIPINVNSYKIHLATDTGTSLWTAYYAGEFKEWQEHQTHRNFKREMVIGLIALKKHKWLFAGVYKVDGYKETKKHFVYNTELLSGQSDLIGRLIVHHERKGRAPYLNGRKDGGEFYLSEIREQKLTIADFPGYNSVCISHRELKIVIGQRIESWHGALSNIKGVYLISDSATGKLYVGSAQGNQGIWQRWKDYADNGHGGNKELKDLLASKPTGYRDNFNYTILEIADFRTSDDEIIDRETHWKNVLLSRLFGYNSN